MLLYAHTKWKELCDDLFLHIIDAAKNVIKLEHDWMMA